MNCEDAMAFCAWLTETERNAGKLDASFIYRLPSDHEWSCAVGIGGQEDAAKTPEEKTSQINVFLPLGRSVATARGCWQLRRAGIEVFD